ncbi:Chorismate--pyruvate lyase [hydrothermal vent metagenome]|uniref:Chorismate--pyruvate lyase n=1 Tax=hydrothermal vent metagenome TaxID=652676 RepID=A0A3B1ATY0_9ZZZZ
MKIKKYNCLHNIGRHVNEPVWKPKYQWINDEIPKNISCWLQDSGSLTKQIIAVCAEQFRVEVVRQQWAIPMLNESLRLQHNPSEYALIREVLLYCGAESWVYARTIMPRKTLTGKQRYLAMLGSKPLGEILFSDPNMQRDELEIARITQQHNIFATALVNDENKLNELWGRRSVFYIGKHKPLLVNEIFLPNILHCQYRHN